MGCSRFSRITAGFFFTSVSGFFKKCYEVVGSVAAWRDRFGLIPFASFVCDSGFPTRSVTLI